MIIALPICDHFFLRHFTILVRFFLGLFSNCENCLKCKVVIFKCWKYLSSQHEKQFWHCFVFLVLMPKTDCLGVQRVCSPGVRVNIWIQCKGSAKFVRNDYLNIRVQQIFGQRNFSIWPLFNSHWQCFAVYDFFSQVECAWITLEMQPYRYKRGIRILLWFDLLQMFGMFLNDHTTSMWLCLIWISKWRFVWLDISAHILWTILIFDHPYCVLSLAKFTVSTVQIVVKVNLCAQFQVTLLLLLLYTKTKIGHENKSK